MDLCPHIDICGGCSLQHLTSDQQIQQKQAVLAKALQAHDVSPIILQDPITGPVWAYRHRANWSVRYVPKKGVLVGFREKVSFKGRHLVADVHTCPILPEPSAALIDPLRVLVGKLTNQNKIPQIHMARDDQRTALVFRHMTPFSEGDLDLLEAFGHEHEVRIYLQAKGLNSIKTLDPEAEDMLSYRLEDFDLELFFHPRHFTQVNPVINRKLIRRAMEHLLPRAGDTILDLYCGIGNFSLPMARRGAKVLGIDCEQPQIDQAIANAAHNGLSDHTRFIRRNLAKPQPNLLEELGQANKILLDPARSGARELINVLPANGPRHIVYVSCNPETFARDAGLLQSQGFALNACTAVDMFPHTEHMETLGYFVR